MGIMASVKFNSLLLLAVKNSRVDEIAIVMSGILGGLVGGTQTNGVA